MHRLLPCLLAGLLLFLSGCGESDSRPTIRTNDPAPFSEPQTLRVNDVELSAEIAISRSEQAKGLMHRESLPADHGMLFLYEAPQRMTFWMKDTLIPLDIGFFAPDGELLEIKRMYPRDRTTVASASDAVQFALEMEQGWFRSRHLVPGAKLDLETVREALANRGTDPAKYGL